MKPATKKYLIRDAGGGGWAYNDPIEGWIFTTMQYAATKFDSRKAAKAAIREHYPWSLSVAAAERLTVVEVEV